MKKEIRIRSLSDYINRVTKLKPRESEMGLYPEEIVFRGLSSCSYPLVPSIGRHPSERWMNSMLTFESDLVSQAQQKFPNIFDNNDLPTTKLAKLQHFGIPTRMMDVTSSALVALYFACQTCSKSELSQDGEVIVISQHSLPASNVFANVIADTYRLTGNAATEIENYYYRAMQQDYCIASRHPNWEQHIKDRANSFMRIISSPLLVEALESSTRQKNQQGKYIIFPNRISTSDEDELVLIVDDLVSLEKNDKTIIKRFIIPKEIKSEIIENLSMLGITEEFLFADSVDTVFKSVKKRQESRFR